jgi:hypothetical protein
MVRLAALSVVAPFALGVIGLLPVATDADDQAEADAAVAVFNERLASAGWSSIGPMARSEPVEPEESVVGDCLGGFDVYLDNTDLRLGGETARSFSDDFRWPVDETMSTAGMSDGPYAGALVLTVDSAAVGPLDAFVDQLGASVTASCVASQPLFQSMESGDATLASAITTESGLGVGESSARLDFRVAADYQGTELNLFGTYAGARVGRSLVVVVTGGTGAAEGNIDPVAELEAMVARLG